MRLGLHPGEPFRELHKLARLIEKAPFAFFTTADGHGRLHGRPMETAEVDRSGDLWFLTLEDSPKVAEIQRDPRVHVSYSCPAEDRYVSISGHASIQRDPRRARELWSPSDQGWMPHGPDDPRIVIIHVRIEQAEYWENLVSKKLELTG